MKAIKKLGISKSLLDVIIVGKKVILVVIALSLKKN